MMERIDIDRKRNRRLYLESDGGDWITIVEEVRKEISKDTWTITKLAVPRLGLGRAIVQLDQAGDFKK